MWIRDGPDTDFLIFPGADICGYLFSVFADADADANANAKNNANILRC